MSDLLSTILGPQLHISYQAAPNLHFWMAIRIQFSLGLFFFIDAATYSHSAKNGSDVHIKFVDWIPGICSALGMLVINSIEKSRLSADSFTYSGTSVAWKARLVLFLGFALMAGGLAGAVVCVALRQNLGDRANSGLHGWLDGSRFEVCHEGLPISHALLWSGKCHREWSYYVKVRWLHLQRFRVLRADLVSQFGRAVDLSEHGGRLHIQSGALGVVLPLSSACTFSCLVLPATEVKPCIFCS